MKAYYSCIDALVTAPQPEQHLVIREKARREGGAITFYGAEEFRSVEEQPFIRWKLSRTPGLDGVVFFTIHQFRRGERFNFALLRQLLREGHEVHFARENLSYRTFEELESSATLLLVLDYVERRDRSEQWSAFLRSLDVRELRDTQR
jgi:hypothetical protein